MQYTFDWKAYAEKARQMAAEGCVLLENRNNALPMAADEKIALFGRIQFDYIKSGNGSGGLVNTPYVVTIPKALKQAGVHIDEELEGLYLEWLKTHPLDMGKGWATEPTCQLEMEITPEIASQAAERNNTAVVIIGRTAGEDRDTAPEKGGYYLNDLELQMLKNVRAAFATMVVVMNIGSIIDMAPVLDACPDALVITWQGGTEGGSGVADVLLGRVNPCGRLADTIAKTLESYPSTECYGNPDQNCYKEDIYVGYRYFETAAKEEVIYPFGYGLSYTEFTHSATVANDASEVKVTVRITNTGTVPGKEVSQVYYCPPAKKLYGAVRNLVGFAKTTVLEPGASEDVEIRFKLSDMDAFDETGICLEAGSRVLEAGEYEIYEGKNVREAVLAGSINIEEDTVTEKLHCVCGPEREYERIVFRRTESGFEKDIDNVLSAKLISEAGSEDQKTSQMGKYAEFSAGNAYKFSDVLNGSVSMEGFIAQIPDNELIYMTRGEGMSSPKVTPGVAGAFGGVSKRLHVDFGIPVAACADGPSGIRMDCGTAAMSLPSGTAQACSFNLELIHELYEFAGQELRKNGVDTLLGPGINIHRNPLNGRNFEYYSEDPYLTGICAATELQALHKYEVTGTIKHFACNNQEYRRNYVDAAVSQRALRDIYLKPFEIAVKQGGAMSLMTSYGPLNGTYTSANKGLTDTILREEWGFDGIVMTDWWTKMSAEGDLDTASMIRARGDLYMVSLIAEENFCQDNTDDEFEKGRLTRTELASCARDILTTMSKLISARKLVSGEDEITEINIPEREGLKVCEMKPARMSGQSSCEVDVSGICTDGGTSNRLMIELDKTGLYLLTFELVAPGNELAQSSMSVTANMVPICTITQNGTNGEAVIRTVEIESLTQYSCFVDLFFLQSGLEIKSLKVDFLEERSK